jgi:hypothetical protein
MDYYHRVVRQLEEAGCKRITIVRDGVEGWESPRTGERFLVDNPIRHFVEGEQGAARNREILAAGVAAPARRAVRPPAGIDDRATAVRAIGVPVVVRPAETGRRSAQPPHRSYASQTLARASVRLR